jgi:two-component system chemotaxis response regulator CheY
METRKPGKNAEEVFMKTYKVLVADDSAVMRMVIVKLLREKYDLEYREAEDGMQAVEAFKEFRPDLVTLDINMPNLDGISALRRILACDSEAKVIVFSTESEKRMIVESVGLGAKAYVMKPIEDREAALAKVTAALGA